MQCGSNTVVPSRNRFGTNKLTKHNFALWPVVSFQQYIYIYIYINTFSLLLGICLDPSEHRLHGCMFLVPIGRSCLKVATTTFAS